MLQSLLADRFKLQYHYEKRHQDAFALVVGRNGLKLQTSPAEGASRADAPVNNTNRPDAMQVGNGPGGMTIRGAGQASALRVRPNDDGSVQFEAERLTMAQLADSLVQFAGKPVVDQTGLSGTYKVVIELSREDVFSMQRQAAVNVPSAPGPALNPPDPDAGVSIFRSVENMGLKLEPRKAPIDYLVIDKLDKTPVED